MGLLNILFKAVLGSGALGVVGLAIYATAKIINTRTVKEEIYAKFANNPEFNEAFAAKVKRKTEKSISLDILDSWNSVILKNVEIIGKEVDDEIKVGTIIKLDE